MIEYAHEKLKRVINPTLGFKSIKTTHVTIKGIEVMRALRKSHAEHFYYGHSSSLKRSASSEQATYFEQKCLTALLYFQQLYKTSQN